MIYSSIARVFVKHFLMIGQRASMMARVLVLLMIVQSMGLPTIDERITGSDLLRAFLPGVARSGRENAGYALLPGYQRADQVEYVNNARVSTGPKQGAQSYSKDGIHTTQQTTAPEVSTAVHGKGQAERERDRVLARRPANSTDAGTDAAMPEPNSTAGRSAATAQFVTELAQVASEGLAAAGSSKISPTILVPCVTAGVLAVAVIVGVGFIVRQNRREKLRAKNAADFVRSSSFVRNSRGDKPLLLEHEQEVCCLPQLCRAITMRGHNYAGP